MDHKGLVNHICDPGHFQYFFSLNGYKRGSVFGQDLLATFRIGFSSNRIRIVQTEKSGIKNAVVPEPRLRAQGLATAFLRIKSIYHDR
jgi:hypothetical protein